MSDGYDFFTGQYPYPLTNVASDGGDFCKPFVPGDPLTAIPDVENFYVICCTPDQMAKIVSSLEVGAPIAYPDFYNDVIQLVDQAVQFPNSFEGAPCVDLCELILECIQTTPELQQAIATYSLTPNINITTPENPGILGTNILPAPVDCDLDSIFGMTLQFADFLNTLSEDVLELFVTAFAAPGRLGDLIEAIPVIGELPADDILQSLEKIATQVNDSYQAAYDSQIREDIACALFCIAQEGCELTFEGARDWFQDQIVEEVSNLDFATVMNDIIANNWLGEQSIYLMHWFLLDAMIFGTEVLGIDHNRMLKTISTFYNDPNPDWSLLCECTGLWAYNSDFPTGEEGWQPFEDVAPADDPRAVWVSGQGWNSVDVPASGSQFDRVDDIFIDIDPTHVDEIVLTYNLTKGSYNNTNSVAVLILASFEGSTVDSRGLAYFQTVNGDDQTLELTPDATIDQIRVVVRSSKQNSAVYSGVAKIVSVYAQGTGDNPFS